MKTTRRLRLTMFFLTTTVAGLGTAVFQFESARRAFLLPGTTTSGHHQIETDCLACHTPMLGVQTNACTRCHGAELELADDSHPASKFRDPRNADRLQKLAALDCVTCHVEHRPDVTFAMGVTQPPDYCVHCHADIGQDRPTHQGLAFDTCQDSGCHNYHDNRALHADFLESQLDAPALVSAGRVMALRARGEHALSEDDIDAPPEARTRQVVSQWMQSAHAASRIHCRDCHAALSDDGASKGAWLASPERATCDRCHAAQVGGFQAGKHGMRLSRGLSPMRPADARLPMKPDAHDRELGCQSCHTAHDYDRSHAAVDACMACHDDPHTRSYRGSKHAALFRAEISGAAPAGSGVSCATCHMPRQLSPDGGEPMVQHNQSDNLRPNDKMVRPVCGQCHSVAFTLDALADRALIARNFTGGPSTHVQSMDMLRDKLGRPRSARPPSTSTQPKEPR